MAVHADRKIVLVTRQTRLAGLRRRFNTVAQAKFYIQRAADIDLMQRAPAGHGAVSQKKRSRRAAAPAADPFAEYEDEDQTYQDALVRLRDDLSRLLPVQPIDRDLLPNFVFGPGDIVVTAGQDGLVANTAKYAIAQLIVAVNPDPARFDGVLMPFRVDQACDAVERGLAGTGSVRRVTLGEATLTNGQSMLAFNDFFIGCGSHVSARYRIEFEGRSEPQSSSGVLVSTGAGSTGWLSSIFNMAAGLSVVAPGGGAFEPEKLEWEDPRLLFVVREPFQSKSSAATMVSGMIPPSGELVLESQMPANGVIFSDGIEADRLEFNAGSVVRIKAAAQQATLAGA